MAPTEGRFARPERRWSWSRWSWSHWSWSHWWSHWL